MRAWTIVALLGLAGAAAAQEPAAPLRFRWHKGDVLTYRVTHDTAVTQVVEGETTTTSSKLRLTKRWQVLDVDTKGVATVQLSLVAMRSEQRRPDGGVLLYDSADPDKSTPALREQLAKHLNQPLAVLKVDPSGQVVQAPKGMANRYECEPPFLVVFPAEPVSAGLFWLRTYQVVLEPPHGTGERYDATQKYVCKRADAAQAVLALTTSFAKLPESQQDRVPLVQKQPHGEIAFDVRAGRLYAAQLDIDQELANHQGSGSRYHFRSRYYEQFVEGP
jgi:hypothetical protein